MSSLPELEAVSEGMKNEDQSGLGMSSPISSASLASSVASSIGTPLLSSTSTPKAPDKPFNEDETDAEIEAMKRRVREMEEEAAKIEEIVEKSLKPQQVANGPSVDARSIYVGNVDYSTTPEELQEFFQSCGTVNRITILCDKYTGHPKGYAYVEFKDQDAIVNAMILNETEFKGRPLKISPKRTNIPGLTDYRASRGRARAAAAAAAAALRAYRRSRFTTFSPRPRFRHRRAVYHPYF